MSNRRKATPAELEFITAARESDRDRLHDALVEMQRDPKRWFCSATDEETGIPRVYGRGDARAEVEANVRSGVRLGPKAMSAQCPDYPKAADQASLFNHLVSAAEQRDHHCP